MNKRGKGQEDRSEEMVSLNEALFSLQAGNLTVEELDRRLELAVAYAGGFVCGTFDCTSFGTCVSFGCRVFKLNQTG